MQRSTRSPQDLQSERKAASVAVSDLTFITPDWPAPPRVRAAVSTRVGGVSGEPYSSLNLGSHVGDDIANVQENRHRLIRALRLPREPVWLNQVHGTNVIDVAGAYSEPPMADASFGCVTGHVCAVMTADCLPVLFCDERGEAIAAAHAGWRGLLGGVLAETLKVLDAPKQRILAWFGPAIEQGAFEVGEEVREQFIARDPGFQRGFVRNPRGRWQADIYDLARHDLAQLGVHQVYGGGFKCFADQERFYSYRRDQRTGRMASLIWLED